MTALLIISLVFSVAALVIAILAFNKECKSQVGPIGPQGIRGLDGKLGPTGPIGPQGEKGEVTADVLSGIIIKDGNLEINGSVTAKSFFESK